MTPTIHNFGAQTLTVGGSPMIPGRYQMAIVLSALVAAWPARLVAQGRPMDTRPTLGVLYFDNGAIAMNGVDYGPLSKGITQIMIAELSQRNPGVRLVE